MGKQPTKLSREELKEYCYGDEWTLAEAIFLLRGKRPENTHDYDNEIFVIFKQDKNHVDDTATDDSILQYVMEPEEWLTWATSKNIEIDSNTKKFLENISSYTYHKKTVNDVDPFNKPSWNINQVLAWIYTKDKSFVKLFDDEVGDYGTHTTKSGKEVQNRPPGTEDFDNYKFPQGYTPEFSNYADVEKELIGKLFNTEKELECFGRENNQGKIKPIPSSSWVDLIFILDTKTIAVTGSTFRDNSLEGLFEDHDETEWHDLRFKREVIVSLWPEIIHDEAEIIRYKPRNIIYKLALDKMISLDDADYGWKGLISKTPSISLNEEKGLVEGKNEFGEYVSVNVKSFQNNFSRMKGNIKNKKSG